MNSSLSRSKYKFARRAKHHTGLVGSTGGETGSPTQSPPIQTPPASMFLHHHSSSVPPLPSLPFSSSSSIAASFEENTQRNVEELIDSTTTSSANSCNASTYSKGQRTVAIMSIMGIAMVAIMGLATTEIVSSSSAQEQSSYNSITTAMAQEERDLSTAIKYKFSFEECVGVTVEECKHIIEEEVMPYNVLHGVKLDVSPMKSPPELFLSEPQDVFIQVNSKGQVLGGGKTSRIEALSAYSEDAASDPNFATGHVGFKVGLNNYGQTCSGLSFEHCCRNVQRAYQRRIRSDEGVETYARIEEEINSTNMGEWDRHCVKEVISPLAEVYESVLGGAGRDSVAYQEFVYNELSHIFELEYIDASEVTMPLSLKTDDSGLISAVPRLNARMALNPTQEFLTKYWTHNEDSTIKSAQMNLVGTDASTLDSATSSSSIFAAMGTTWYYSVPMAIGIVSACSCCFFLIFMCCIPVKDPDDLESDADSDAGFSDNTHEAKHPDLHVHGGAHTMSRANIYGNPSNNNYDFDNGKYVE